MRETMPRKRYFAEDVKLAASGNFCILSRFESRP
jgi:hypothetical protein